MKKMLDFTWTECPLSSSPLALISLIWPSWTNTPLQEKYSKIERGQHDCYLEHLPIATPWNQEKNTTTLIQMNFANGLLHKKNKGIFSVCNIIENCC